MNSLSSKVIATGIHNDPFTRKMISSLPWYQKAGSWLISSQENTSGLSHIKFIQGTATNWLPKAVLSRSKADLVESTFLELLESVIFYYSPALLGENIFKRLFSKFLPDNKKNLIAEPAKNLLENKDLIKNKSLQKLLPAKAGMILACMCIPMASYALSYAKNLFTLKVFKKADFSKIANLNKSDDKPEDAELNKKVERSAKNKIKLASLISLIGLVSGIALAKLGPGSKKLQSLSKAILLPGTKLCSAFKITNPKVKNFMEKYLNLDFANGNGKLCLSQGQLVATILTSAFGYLGAAKDRGRLEFLETLTRIPITIPYVIFGSSILEDKLKQFLHNKKSFPSLITKNDKTGSFEVPALTELSDMAKNIAKKNGTSAKEEWLNLFKGKSIISLTPFLVSLVGMGFVVGAVSRLWTKLRYKQGIGKEPDNKTNNNQVPMPKTNLQYNPFANRTSSYPTYNR